MNSPPPIDVENAQEIIGRLLTAARAYQLQAEEPERWGTTVPAEKQLLAAVYTLLPILDFLEIYGSVKPSALRALVEELIELSVSGRTGPLLTRDRKDSREFALLKERVFRGRAVAILEQEARLCQSTKSAAVEWATAVIVKEARLTGHKFANLTERNIKRWISLSKGVGARVVEASAREELIMDLAVIPEVQSKSGLEAQLRREVRLLPKETT